MTSPPPDPSGVVVWTRDTSRASRTWVKWSTAALTALAAFMIVGGIVAGDSGQTGSIVGLIVVLVALLWAIPWVFDFQKRRNPEIRLVGRELAWAKVRVPVDQITTWRVGERTVVMNNGTTMSRSRLGFVQFTRIDGKPTEFLFPSLPEHERRGLAQVLDQVLPGRRHPDSEH